MPTVESEDSVPSMDIERAELLYAVESWPLLLLLPNTCTEPRWFAVFDVPACAWIVLAE